jgi:hypothetical protein
VLKQRSGLEVRVETHTLGLAELDLTYDPTAVSVTRIDGPQGAERPGTTPGSLKLQLRGDAVIGIEFAVSAPAGSTLLATLRSSGASSKAALRL